LPPEIQVVDRLAHLIGTRFSIVSIYPNRYQGTVTLGLKENFLTESIETLFETPSTVRLKLDLSGKQGDGDSFEIRRVRRKVLHVGTIVTCTASGARTPTIQRRPGWCSLESVCVNLQQ
jgi:hypothetical protein